MSIEVMRQALEALEHEANKGNDNAYQCERDALRTAIEQGEKQKPVALKTIYETIINWDEGGGKRSRRELARRIVDLYTTPPVVPRQWVGLTNKDIIEMWPETSTVGWDDIRLIEAKLKEKNA
jgi:hypothetical protein